MNCGRASSDARILTVRDACTVRAFEAPAVMTLRRRRVLVLGATRIFTR